MDFVLKVLSSFPEVELYWLLNGKGKFPSEENQETKIASDKNVIAEKNLHNTSEINQTSKISSKEKSIERIIIFYTDGSFKNFEEH